MGNLTANFSTPEFECKCGCGLNHIQPDAVRRAQMYRDHIGSWAQVNSGCRCKKHNAEEGGADGSLHLIGWATDLEFLHASIPFVYSKAYGLWLTFDYGGLILYDSFIHQDIGNKRFVDRRINNKGVAYA